jgi:hypothetical protein
MWHESFQIGSTLNPLTDIVRDLWMSSTEITNVSSPLSPRRIPCTPSRLPPRIRTRFPTSTKEQGLGHSRCSITDCTAAISLSGIVTPSPLAPTKEFTPDVRNTAMRVVGSTVIRTKTYCGNKGTSTTLSRSLHWCFSGKSGRKDSIPFRRSSPATFFSCRGKVCTAYHIGSCGDTATGSNAALVVICCTDAIRQGSAILTHNCLYTAGNSRKPHSSVGKLP